MESNLKIETREEKITRLRLQTGFGRMQIRVALEKSNGDEKKALSSLYQFQKAKI